MLDRHLQVCLDSLYYVVFEVVVLLLFLLLLLLLFPPTETDIIIEKECTTSMLRWASKL